MTSEIVILITELRNKQRITLPAGSYRFGRSAQCEYVLRRNNVGDHQFTVSFANGQWGVTDGGSDYRTWYNNRYLEPGETSILQSGDVIGLNTDGDADTQEITFRVEEITSVQGDGMAPKRSRQPTPSCARQTSAASAAYSSGAATTATSSSSMTASPAITARFCTRTATTSCMTSARRTAPMWTASA